jgi:hypothetical protein
MHTESSSTKVCNEDLSGLRFPIVRAGKWGAIDGHGRIAIEPQFASMSDFDHNTGLAVAAVMLAPREVEQGDSSEAHKCYGAINRDGKWIIAPAFDHLEDFDPVSGLAVARRTQDANNTQELKLGFISPDGAWRIPRQFSKVKPFHPTCKLAPACLKFDWGLIDVLGNWAVTPAFEDIAPFDDETSLFWACQKGSWGLLRPDGAWAISPRFASWEAPRRGGEIAWAKEGRAYDEAIDTPNSRIRVGTTFGGRGQWHIVRRDGTHVACPEINGSFPPGWFKKGENLCIARSAAGPTGILNREGQWVMPPKNDRIADLNEELRLVLVQENERWGWMDFAGKWMLPPDYEILTLPHVRLRTAWAKRDGKWALLDSTGQIQRMLPFDMSASPRSTQTRFIAESLPRSGEKKCGWMGWDGDWIVAPEYQSLMIMAEDAGILLATLESGKEGILLAPQTWLVAPEVFASYEFCSVRRCSVASVGGQWIRIIALSEGVGVDRDTSYYINLRNLEVVLGWDVCEPSPLVRGREIFGGQR